MVRSAYVSPGVADQGGDRRARVWQTRAKSRERPRSEQPRVPGLESAHRVVVEQQAPDAAIGRERARLGLDLLGREDARHRGEVRVAIHELEVSGQLLDTVDVAAPLDLHGDRRPFGVAREDV